MNPQFHRLIFQILVISLCFVAYAQCQRLEKQILNNFISTSTKTLYALHSSTVFPFCFTGNIGDGSACTKRKRKLLTIPFKKSLTSEGTSLDSSNADLETSMKLSNTFDQRNAKFFLFTIWRTVSSTSTVTMLLTNSDSTIQVSYYCFVPGLSLPPSCN